VGDEHPADSPNEEIDLPGGRVWRAQLSPGRRDLIHRSARAKMNADEVVALVNGVADGDDPAAVVDRLDLYGAKALRTACVKLNLRPQSSSNADSCNTKAGLVALLAGYVQARQDGASAGAAGPSKPTPSETSTRLTKNCSFRLMNILFSDQFADRLQEVNAAATRGAIETGAINDGAIFWRDVANAYASKDTEYDSLVMGRVVYDGINPSAAVLHNPAKLRKLWQRITSRYSLAYTRAHQSGTHESDFFDFCDGRLDTLYVHDWLKVKPQLLSQVDGRIPESARVDTLESDGGGRTATDSDAPASKRQRINKTPRTLERIVRVLEANAERRAPSALAAVRDVAQSATQVLQMISALKAAGGNSTLIEELQLEANELAKQAAAGLRKHREANADAS
jgi:hypothetical protein